MAETIRGADAGGRLRVAAVTNEGESAGGVPLGAVRTSDVAVDQLLEALVLETRAVRIGMELQLRLRTGDLLRQAGKP